MINLTIRPLCSGDSDAAVNIFHDAVMNGTAAHYSLAQRQAWAGPRPDREGWREKFREVEGIAAEIDGTLICFMTLDRAGHIDLAFIHSDWAGHGIGRRLYEAIEAKALSDGVVGLTTEASEPARPFFERMGWHVEMRQKVVKRGVALTNYRLSKALT